MATLNVRDYGAVGDGRSDDTQAIRDAIAELNEGDTLYFPESDDAYLVSGDDKSREGTTAITIFGDNLPDDVTFTGDGRGSVVRMDGGHEGNHAVFRWRPQGGIVGHEIRNLKVDGNRHQQPADPTDHDNGLNLAVTDADSEDVTVDITFENVWSVDANTECFTLLQGGCVANRCTAIGAGKHGFGVDSQGKTGPITPPIRVTGSYATDCDLYGVDCSGGNIVIENSVFEGNTLGTKVTPQGFDITYRRVRFADNDSAGYQRIPTPTETGSRQQVTFEDVISEGNGEFSFRFGRDTDHTVVGTVIATGNARNAQIDCLITDNATLDASEGAVHVNRSAADYAALQSDTSRAGSVIGSYYHFGNSANDVGKTRNLTIHSRQVQDVPDLDSVPTADEVGAGTAGGPAPGTVLRTSSAGVVRTNNGVIDSE